jgi:tetratricopeptide (TPR) repeat protein
VHDLPIFSQADHYAKDFWSSRKLVQLWFPGMTIPQLAVESSKQEWAAQAHVYFEKEEYYRAMSCFENASMRDKAAVAQAYHLRADARMMTSGSRQRSKALVNAAEAFRKCAKPTAKREYLRTAAECYDSAGEVKQAAQSYEEAEAFDIAAQRYCNSNMFEAACRLIKKHERMMSTHVVNGVKDKIRVHYFENNEPRCVRTCSF